MELRESHRTKNILVSSCGRLFYKDTGKPLTINAEHGTSTRGPVATYRDFKSRKTRCISVSTEVLECYVLHRKSVQGEYVTFIDGKENNCRAENIKLTDRKPILNREDYKTERHDSWLNGDGCIYI
jgi:hypothetical protein